MKCEYHDKGINNENSLRVKDEELSLKRHDVVM